MMRKAAIFLVLGLSACSRAFNGADDGLSVAESHPIVVQPDAATLELYVEPGQKRLSAEDAEAVNGFIGEFKMRGHSLLEIALPTGSANAASAKTIAREIQRMVYNRGLSNAYIEGASYAADPGDSSAPITLSFTRYTASANECGDWSRSLGYTPGNLRHPNYGCATQNNLAAMVEDPRDLVTPRGMTASDIERRTIVIETYRQGKVTGAERSTEESGKASETDEKN